MSYFLLWWVTWGIMMTSMNACENDVLFVSYLCIVLFYNDWQWMMRSCQLLCLMCYLHSPSWFLNQNKVHSNCHALSGKHELLSKPICFTLGFGWRVSCPNLVCFLLFVVFCFVYQDIYVCTFPSNCIFNRGHYVVSFLYIRFYYIYLNMCLQ